MRGYPKGALNKRDFENLMNMKEHADRAKADLVKLAEVDDEKITVDQGTEKEQKLVVVTNPLPAWKKAGYKSKLELTQHAEIAAVKTEL